MASVLKCDHEDKTAVTTDWRDSLHIILGGTTGQTKMTWEEQAWKYKHLFIY